MSEEEFRGRPAERQQELVRLLRERHYRLAKLAERMNVTVRTLERDLVQFGDRLGEPVPQDATGYFLTDGMHPAPPPISLDVQEARALLFASRLLIHNADEQDGAAVSALQKISAAFPGTVGDYLGVTVSQLLERPQSKESQSILRRITEAWDRHRTLEIRYRSPGRRPRTHLVDPYLLEPNPTSSAAYLVGHNHDANALGVFVVDRITRAEMMPATFAPPDLGALAARLARSWAGVILDEHDYEVVVDFTANVAQRVRESFWHPHRTFVEREDGGIRLTLQLSSLIGVAAWVYGWGPDAEVIAPPELREDVSSNLRNAAARYETRRNPGAGGVVSSGDLIDGASGRKRREASGQ
jgi:proteasome accessory factor B